MDYRKRKYDSNKSKGLTTSTLNSERIRDLKARNPCHLFQKSIPAARHGRPSKARPTARFDFPGIAREILDGFIFASSL